MTSNMLELDEVIRRYAWTVLKRRSNFLRRWLLEEKDYVCEVEWSALSMEHKVAKFASREEDNTKIDTNFGKVTTGSRWVSLWSCDFDNKADMKQTHTFRGSRNTTTWVDVDIEQCYTINKEVNVEVNIPPNLSKFRAGRDNSFSLNKVKGQVFKEVLTWEVNSQVEVLPAWRAHAELLAREECQSMEFEIRTTIYNPSGILPVYFKRKSDRRLMYVVDLENFENAFMDEEEGCLKPEEKPCLEVMIQRSLSPDGQETTSSCHPQLITRGTCVCLTWSDQRVDMTTTPLSPPTLTLQLDTDDSAFYDSSSTDPITTNNNDTSSKSNSNTNTIVNQRKSNISRWRDGSDGNSARSSLDADAECSDVILTSSGVNGTMVVSGLEERRFVVRAT